MHTTIAQYKILLPFLLLLLLLLLLLRKTTYTTTAIFILTLFSRERRAIEN